jgi:hypothetical protein
MSFCAGASSSPLVPRVDIAILPDDDRNATSLRQHQRVQDAHHHLGRGTMNSQEIEQSVDLPVAPAHAGRSVIDEQLQAHDWAYVRRHGFQLEQFVEKRPFVTGVILGVLGTALGLVVKRIISHNLPGKPTTPPPFDD